MPTFPPAVEALKRLSPTEFHNAFFEACRTSSNTFTGECEPCEGTDVARVANFLRATQGSLLPFSFPKRPLSQLTDLLAATRPTSEDALVIFSVLAKEVQPGPERYLRLANIALERTAWRAAAIRAHPAVFRQAHMGRQRWHNTLRALAGAAWQPNPSRPEDANTYENVKAALDALAKAGVRDDADDKGRTAAFTVATGYNKAAIRAFLDHFGLGIHQLRNTTGDTPLHAIARQMNGGPRIASLIALGADPRARNHAGDTPLDIAVAEPEMAEIALDANNVRALLATKAYTNEELDRARSKAQDVSVLALLDAHRAHGAIVEATSRVVDVNPL